MVVVAPSPAQAAAVWGASALPPGAEGGWASLFYLSPPDSQAAIFKTPPQRQLCQFCFLFLIHSRNHAV